MPTVLNLDLYHLAKEEADKIYKKPSAYKSGFIQKKYKELGGKYKDDGRPKTLKRWFQEGWKNIGHRGYPVYRPTIRVNKKTPLTVDEIDKKNLKKQILLKQILKGENNLPPFQKRHMTHDTRHMTKKK